MTQRTLPTKLLNCPSRPGRTSRGTSVITAEMTYVAPSPSLDSSRTQSDGNHSSGRICAKAFSGSGSGRGISGGTPLVSVTSPSNTSTSGKARCTSSDTSMPFGKTSCTTTIPLATKVVPLALIFMSRIVTFRSSSGRGVGAGKLAEMDKPGWRGDEMEMAFGFPDR